VTLIVRGRGHPSVRASHGKTLELTPETHLGPGGTCVVAVRSTVAGEPLAGAVECVLTAGAHRAEFTATANPDWDGADRAVLRRSAVRKRDTIATHASLAAADLPPEMVDALRDPEQEIVLEVRRAQPQPDRLVIIADGEVPPAERDAADHVADPADAQVGGRTLVVGVPPPAVLAEAPQPVEVHGLPIQRAAAVASPYGAEAVLGTVHDLATRRDVAVVARIHEEEFDKVIRSARKQGRRTGSVVGHLPWVHWGALDALPKPVGVRVLWLCFDPAPTVDLEARIAEALATGASTKQVAKALAGEFGLSAKSIYAQITGKKR
jgi:hypothetical protein